MSGCDRRRKTSDRTTSRVDDYLHTHSSHLRIGIHAREGNANSPFGLLPRRARPVCRSIWRRSDTGVASSVSFCWRSRVCGKRRVEKRRTRRVPFRWAKGPWIESVVVVSVPHNRSARRRRGYLSNPKERLSSRALPVPTVLNWWIATAGRARRRLRAKESRKEMDACADSRARAS